MQIKHSKIAKLLLILIVIFGGIYLVLSFDQTKTSHQMYIWQRNWNPEVAQAIKKWQGELNGLRILAGFGTANKISPINIKWQWLPKQTETTLVYRLNGQKLPEVKLLTKLIFQQLTQAKQVGIAIESLEIDFDAATSKLKNYTHWLKQLKQTTSPKLSITALPTWHSSKNITQLLAVVDHYVLQVHSVLSPQQGLFDKDLALKWAKQFNQLSNTHFSIALPDYWYQASLDGNQQIKSLSAEERNEFSSSNTQMLFASPLELHQTMQSIEKLNLQNFQDWVWFRMPTSKDKRIFSDTTLKQLLNPIQENNNWQLKASTIQLKAIKPQSHHYDLWLTNPNSIDASTEAHYNLPQGCQINHLISAFTSNNTKITPNNKQLLKAQSEQRIGWVSCQSYKP